MGKVQKKVVAPDTRNLDNFVTFYEVEESEDKIEHVWLLKQILGFMGIRLNAPRIADEPPFPVKCGYLTDVEGNFDYLERYVEISDVLRWTDRKKTALELVDGCMFVYGGDSQDKGIGDIRVARLLVELKKRHRDRVVLLIGNRDANKLRLCSELSDAAIADPTLRNDRGFPYWVPEAKRVTPADYLAKTGEKDNAASRLRWILKETMGADGAFERRRQELAILERQKRGLLSSLSSRNVVVSDEEVVESYRRSVEPGAGAEEGFMLEYLREAQLAFVFGRTLFVHGGLTDANIGTVPGKEEREPDVGRWVALLNRWAEGEVAAYEQRYQQDSLRAGNTRARGGHGLMDYGVPGGNGGATVVYASHLDNGNAALPSPRVRQYLSRSGVAAVVVGHTPHGTCPSVMRAPEVTLLTADTSYSEMGHKSEWGVDNRGAAVSEVVVWEDGAAEVRGLLPDGRPLRYTVRSPLHQRRGAAPDDEFVGRQLADGRWVKAKGEGEGARYLVCKGEGFKLSYHWLAPEQLRALPWAQAPPLPADQPFPCLVQ